MKFNPFIIIKLILLLFMSIGLGLTVFMILNNVKIIGAYVTSGLFFLFPAILFYGLTFGFKISEKTIQRQKEREESVTFDNKGIWYKIPILDTIQFIDWTTIEKVIYTNYQSDDNPQFIFYLTEPPVQSLTKNHSWINKIILRLLKNKKEIIIKDDCQNFTEIPKMLETYLGKINTIDLTIDYRKGVLVSSNTVIKNNVIETEELWKGNLNYEREKVIYDKNA